MFIKELEDLIDHDVTVYIKEEIKFCGKLGVVDKGAIILHTVENSGKRNYDRNIFIPKGVILAVTDDQ